MKGHKRPAPDHAGPSAPGRTARGPDAGLSPMDALAEQAAFGNRFLTEQLGRAEGDGGHASEDPDEPPARRCLQRPSVLCRCPAAERARKEAGDPMDCSRLSGWSAF